MRQPPYSSDADKSGVRARSYRLTERIGRLMAIVDALNANTDLVALSPATFVPIARVWLGLKDLRLKDEANTVVIFSKVTTALSVLKIDALNNESTKNGHLTVLGPTNIIGASVGAPDELFSFPSNNKGSSQG